MDQYAGIAGTAGSLTFAHTTQDIAPGEIASLRNEIDRYATTLDELHARLDAVLKPEYAEPNAKLDHPMPVMSEIAAMRSQLAANTARLNALIGRIDL